MSANSSSLLSSIASEIEEKESTIVLFDLLFFCVLCDGGIQGRPLPEDCGTSGADRLASFSWLLGVRVIVVFIVEGCESGISGPDGPPE